MKIHGLAAIALLASAASFAQENRGTFSGLVTDAQGAAIAKAKITAIEKSTGNKSETLSSETGEYTIPFLAPGVYEITAEMSGFKTYKREGLTLSIGEHPQVDVKLEVGASNQSVMVTAEVPMIESANASVGQVISAEEVEDVPMNGRTPLMLSRISMGVTGTNEPGRCGRSTTPVARLSAWPGRPRNRTKYWSTAFPTLPGTSGWPTVRRRTPYRK